MVWEWGVDSECGGGVGVGCGFGVRRVGGVIVEVECGWSGGGGGGVEVGGDGANEGT